MHKLILKWQSLYAQKQMRDPSLEQYTVSYINDKLIPMWQSGWMKLNDIQSHCMPKPKVKEPKKPANEVKTSKALHSTANNAQPTLPNADNSTAMAAPNSTTTTTTTTEKKKSHKEPLKSIKNASDKPPTPKTDKKYTQHLISTPDRPIVPPLLAMNMNDGFNPKSV